MRSLRRQDALLIVSAVNENFALAAVPRNVTAAIQTTAIRATNRIYSTSDAPSSSRTSSTAEPIHFFILGFHLLGFKGARACLPCEQPRVYSPGRPKTPSVHSRPA